MSEDANPVDGAERKRPSADGTERAGPSADEADGPIVLAVPPAPRPARLDAWVSEALRDAMGEREAPSRSRLKALIAEGALLVGGRTPDGSSHRLRGGERIELRVPQPREAVPAPEPIALDILHEDDALIVLVKPVGMVVHPGAGVASGTLVNALLHHCRGSLSGIGGVARPGIVHRLDRDTSGVMVVAKTDAAHRALSAQFADHGRTGPLERSYLALVWGAPVPAAGTIDAPLGRDARERTRRAVSEGSDARSALTHYGIEEALGAASLVRCRLETGRTHQIRVHMAHIGHPLLGDATYGASHRSKAARLGEEARKALSALTGQALHAETLAFAHPGGGATMRFSAVPPPPFSRLVEALRAEG